MDTGAGARATGLAVPGGPGPWERAGFTCLPDGFAAGEVSVLLGAGGVAEAKVILAPSATLDGAGLKAEAWLPASNLSGEHPNGVIGVDHVVISTPDFERSRAAFTAAGLDLRREREARVGEENLRQGFFLAGSCLLELVGDRGPAGRPAMVWGVTFVTVNLESLPALDPAPVATIADAVQPGRRIAVAREQLGLPTRVAFMDPRDKAGSR